MSASQTNLRLLDWARLRMHLVFAYVGAPSVLVYKGHHTPAMSAWLLLRGGVEVEDPDGSRVVASCGQWVFPSPGYSGNQFTEDAEILSVRTLLFWPNGDLLFTHPNTLVVDEGRYPVLQPAAKRLIRCLKPLGRGQKDQRLLRLPYESAEFSQYLTIQKATIRWVEVCTAMMADLGVERTSTQTSDLRIVRAQLILDHLELHQPPDLGRVARMAGLSLSQLNRLFVAQIGLTPKAYFDRRRLESAKQQLLSTPDPIKQIAYQLGFKQASHFTRWFDSHAGFTPRAFRSTRYEAIYTLQ